MRYIKHSNTGHSNTGTPSGAYKGEDFPLDGTHPDYPDLYRVDTPQLSKLHAPDEDQPHPCDECLDVQERCDRTCGFGRVWVGAVTRLRIRMMENQA